jgi:lipoprotein-releasing system permease protein
MGATPTLLRRTFLLLGALIGVTGIVIGEGLALALALLQQRYGIIPLPAEAYFMKTAPIELAALDFVLVAVLTVLLCALAAYLPARFAGRIQPIRAIHFR